MRVNFTSNLGNQMYCYAFGKSLSLLRNTTVFFDRKTNVDCFPYLTYSMDVYDLDIRFDDSEGVLYPEEGLGYDKKALHAPDDTVFDGHWFTEKYMLEAGTSDVVRKELSLPKGEPNDPTLEVAKLIKSEENSAFIHVRHGDFLSPDKLPYHGVPSMEYYLEGMERIEKDFPKTKFFVFSDDPEWCKENFKDENCTVVHPNSCAHVDKQGQWDIWLMSLCKNAVIANSSFSWWGAWLNPNPKKMVFAPKAWFTSAYEVYSEDIVPESWTKL